MASAGRRSDEVLHLLPTAAAAINESQKPRSSAFSARPVYFPAMRSQ